ncbi:helix-turn-helix transcriptional regulator [Streptomyces sp. NPDC001508]|uniref:helix-turn-helix transcriptional regulator n=1 Tax=Streptomyces sp. NPDC001508 TaxID=3154656 RepID=UPI003325A795
MLSQPAFGRLLRRLRIERGLSQADLAGPGVSASYVSRLESGDRPATEAAAVHLAERLGVDVQAFAGAPGADRAMSLLASGMAALDDGSAADAVRDLTEAARATPDDAPDTAWQTLWHLAKAHALLGDREEQRRVLLRLRPLLTAQGMTALEAHALAATAECDRALGDVDSAILRAREAVALAGGEGAAGSLEALLVLASSEVEAGRLSEAAEHADLLLARSAGATGGQRTRILWTASTVRARRGAEQESLALLEEAVAGADAQQDLLAWARLRLAAVAQHLRVHGRLAPDAVAWFDEARSALRMIGLPQHLTEVRALEARIAFSEGDHTAAAALSRGVVEEPGALSFHDRIRAEILLYQAEAATGSFETAVRELRRLADEVTRSGNLDLAAEAWKALAEGAVVRGT